jgi:hypothetical protein
VAKRPAFQFYPGDWLRDGVAGCSLAAQGLWLRLMILMHDTPLYGHLCTSTKGAPLSPAAAARRCGCTLEEFTILMQELEENGVPSRTSEGCVYSRKMVRDEAERAGATLRQRHHRASVNYVKPKGNGASRKRHADVTPMSQRSSSSSSSSSSEIHERESAQLSRFSLAECRKYADSLKGIKSPAAFAKSIWRSGEDDDQVAEFLARGDSGNAVKKPPDKPVDVAEIQRIAAEFDEAQLHDIADALRASIQTGGAK